MNEYDIKRLALVLSLQAEMEGMKVANSIRADNYQAPAYGENLFQEIAHQLSDLAHKHDHQL